MVEPATAAIAVLSTIAGVSGYGAMKINSNQAMVMEELATRLAAEKIGKLRIQQGDELRAKEQKYQSEASADKQKIAELDRYIADLKADAEKLNADLKQATEGERLFGSVSLPGFKKAIKTFQMQRQATDGDEAMGAKTAAALKKVFDNYTSSVRLNISRGSMTSLYNDLSKAVGKPYMDQEEFERVLTDILRGVDGSLEGDRTVAEEQRKREQVTQRTVAAEAAAAELQRRKNEKESAAAAKKEAAEAAAAELQRRKNEKEAAAAAKKEAADQAARLKESQKAEKQAAKAAEAQRKADAKTAATKQASTQIHDTLMSSMKEALQWYTTTSDAIYQKREKELDVIQRYIPDDTEVKDAITEANNYSGFLVKYKNLLNRKYEIYKGKVGTKKFNLAKYIRGQDNEYKPLDESFFEREPKPLPMRELKLPIVGGGKIRRKGGAFETLIASRKDIDVEIDFYRKVRAHVETYMEKLNSLLRRKREYIQEQGIQDPGEEDTVAFSSNMRGTPDTSASTALFGKEPPKPPGVEVPTFPSSRPDVLSPEGVFRQPDQMTSTTADFSDFKAPITGTQQFAFTNPGIANKAAFAKTQRTRPQGPGTTRKNARVPAPTPFSLDGGPAAGTGILPPPPPQPTDLSSIPPPPSVTPGSLPPSLIPGFGTAKRGDPTKFGGPLPRYTGGSRKKKLRSRRGGKQKNNVRRTRRS